MNWSGLFGYGDCNTYQHVQDERKEMKQLYVLKICNWTSILAQFNYRNSIIRDTKGVLILKLLILGMYTYVVQLQLIYTNLTPTGCQFHLPWLYSTPFRLRKTSLSLFGNCFHYAWSRRSNRMPLGDYSRALCVVLTFPSQIHAQKFTNKSKPLDTR
jgi:hypothetical protein